MELKLFALNHNPQIVFKIPNRIWHQRGVKKTTHLQIREALKMHLDGRALCEAGKILMKMLINRR
jgi:hypothetical protein